MTQLHTWREGDPAAWIGEAPPAAFDTLPADTTTWIYNDATGLLLGKRDAAGLGYTYTWHDSGLLATRTNARNTVTTHTYDPLTGDLTGVSHSDDTPGYSRTWRRDGSPHTITDVSGTRTFAYENADPTRPSGESYVGGLLAGVGLAYPETFGRRQSLTASLDGTVLQQVGHVYDTLGRLETLASLDHQATYGYHAGSSLIETIDHGDGALLATRVYDGVDRLQSIGYTAGQTAVTAHTYSYDAASRRTAATREDGAFWLYGYNDRDEKRRGIGGVLDGASAEPEGRGPQAGGPSQVVSAKKHLPNGQVLAGWQQGFAYDSIGNRKSMEKGGDADGENLRVTDYTANRLNQYAQVVHPTLFDALGLAHPDATVTVNGQPADRQGAMWRKELEAGNASGPAFPEVEVEATRTGAGPGGGEVRVVERGGHFVDPVFLAPRHDADGNLLSDGRWGYTWDAEQCDRIGSILDEGEAGARRVNHAMPRMMNHNRLVAMRTHPAAVAAGVPEERYEFTYDAEWRRVRQRVWRWDEEAPGEAAGTLGAFVLVRDERTVYDGWNPVAQIDATGAVVQRHLWGLDLSGTAQGAGGVGGLLGTWDNGTTTREGLRESGPGVGNGNGNGEPRAWYVAYDGNGNVSAVITTGNGGTENRRTAFYDYEAFGKVLASWGDADLLAANRYRFSTKPEDGTGLLYYGFRYYSPSLGRWLSRDPIEESGGLNLYGFVGNNSANGVDYLGLDRINDLSNFVAAVGDSLTFGLSRQARKALNYQVDRMFYEIDPGQGAPLWEDSGINPNNSWYIAGEVTSITVEIVVTCGGAGLRHIARHASREALEAAVGPRGGATTGRQLFRRAYELSGGYVHHWTSIIGHPAMRGGPGRRIARFPLPFKFAANGHWNMVHVATREGHMALHRAEQFWERMDEFRTSTMFIRQAMNRLLIYLEQNEFHDSEVGISANVGMRVEALKFNAPSDDDRAQGLKDFYDEMERLGIPRHKW